jgi:Protein of unknown function (DUF2723)
MLRFATGGKNKNRLWLALAFGAPLLLYIPTLLSDVAYWDTGEMQTIPYIFGIAHPTGFPLFTLVGGVFSRLLPFGTVAWRLSFMCALAMAGAAAATVALACELGAELPAAVVGAWLFAVGEVAWTRGTRAEVHALAVLLALLALVYAVRFRRTGETRALYGCALWLGFGVADHPVVVLIVPGLLMLFAPRYRVLFGNVGLRACAIVLACLSLYVYLPLRGAYVYAHRTDPTLSLGIPPGRPYWDYGYPVTWNAFKREVFGEDFNAAGTLASVFQPARYPSMILAYVERADRQLSIPVVMIATAGFFVLLSADPWLCLGTVLAGMLSIPFAFSYRAESDIDRYFLISYALIAAYAAAGLSRLLHLFFPRFRTAAIVLSALVLCFPVAQAVTVNYMTVASAHRAENARTWINRVRAETPSNAIIIAEWGYATPLAYAAYVEHRLGRRIVETAWITDDRKYLARWMAVRPVYVSSRLVPSLSGYVVDRVDEHLPPLYRLRAAARFR